MLCFLFLILTVQAQKYTVTGGRATPLLATIDDNQTKNEGLEVYLVYGMENVQISYTSSSTSHQWYRYKNRKLEAEQVPSVQNGTTSVVSNIEEGYGYFVAETGLSESYVWIIDYSKYAFNITSFYVDTQRRGCDYMALGGTADMTEIKYNTPSGSSKMLKREFEITFQTMEMAEDQSMMVPTSVTKTITDPFTNPITPAPYCDTDVTLKGDLFARHFGVEKVITSDVYQAIAIVDPVVIQIDTISYTEAPNMVIKGDSLSAPVEFNFRAIANTPVAAVFSWTISKKNEGTENTALATSTNEETSFLFNENGTYIVHLEVADRTLQCIQIPEDITINISDTYLEVPNAFSPGTTPGMNDEFRVAYRSLNSFKCWIFNRWGQQLYYWTDPSQGWDGKKGGKYVAPGVYFYVIEATGSDGKSIKRKGSINILRSKRIQDEIIEE